jgi:hypothetical protein
MEIVLRRREPGPGKVGFVQMSWGPFVVKRDYSASVHGEDFTVECFCSSVCRGWLDGLCGGSACYGYRHLAICGDRMSSDQTHTRFQWLFCCDETTAYET